MSLDTNELNSIWELIAEKLKGKHYDVAFKLWFSDMKLVSLTDEEAMFTTPTNQKRTVILKNFTEEIATYTEEIVGFKPRVIILSTENTEIDLSSHNVALFEKIERGEATDSTVIMPGDYRSDYTFDNFIVGSSNKFAHAAALAVAEKNLNDPETLRSNMYNPLFIYGPSGVGKTHLLYAITNKISRKYPDKKIIYVKGEEFTNQLVEAIQHKTTTQFREKYRSVDVLLIDDIQFVAGRISTQEEVFNTFNAVYEEHKQIILTSDRPPNEIKTLEERLRTRFLSGLLADVSLPDFDLRLAILQQKAKQNNIYLDQNTMKYIADNVTSSIRQLEGVIKKLGAITLLEGGELNFERVRDSIKDFVQVKENDSKKMDDIIMAVTQKYGVSREDILSSKRHKEIAMARHICVFLASELTGLSQGNIAKILNRDRTTIISSKNVVLAEMNASPDFGMEITDLMAELR